MSTILKFFNRLFARTDIEIEKKIAKLARYNQVIHFLYDDKLQEMHVCLFNGNYLEFYGISRRQYYKYLTKCVRGNAVMDHLNDDVFIKFKPKYSDNNMVNDVRAALESII